MLDIASRTDVQETLRLERERMAVQRQVNDGAGHRSAFTFLPDIVLEDVPIALFRYAEGISHMSVHSADAGLWFAREAFDNGVRDSVPLDGASVAAFFDPVRPPKRVPGYLRSELYRRVHRAERRRRDRHTPPIPANLELQAWQGRGVLVN